MVRPLLMLAGLLGIVWLCQRIGWPAIRQNIAVIGQWFFLLVVLYLFAQMAFMSGWWVLIGSRARQIGYWRMFGVYLVGDSVNYFVPPANLAGEPVKAHLLSRSVGFSRSVTSIMVHKHAEIVAQVLFLSFSLGVAVTQFALPAALQVAALILAAGMGVAVVAAFWALKRGAFGALIRGLVKIGLKPEQINPEWRATASLDRWLALFYKTRMPVFYWATFLCLLGWCGGLLETYIVLQWLSAKPSLAMAVSVESLAMVLNTLIFFIPGRVGERGNGASRCLFGSRFARCGGRRLQYYSPGERGHLGDPRSAHPAGDEDGNRWGRLVRSQADGHERPRTGDSVRFRRYAGRRRDPLERSIPSALPR
ncbi:MAG: flippase-like domain-containing protein [Candidatus Methylomirabilis sp.]|nr:flippase-like domain-containing protein [Candidatus Methylomirabilis sp.]